LLYYTETDSSSLHSQYFYRRVVCSRVHISILVMGDASGILKDALEGRTSELCYAPLHLKEHKNNIELACTTPLNFSCSTFHTSPPRFQSRVG